VVVAVVRILRELLAAREVPEVLGLPTMTGLLMPQVGLGLVLIRAMGLLAQMGSETVVVEVAGTLTLLVVPVVVALSLLGIWFRSNYGVFCET
jgi:hypothetical protein